MISRPKAFVLFLLLLCAGLLSAQVTTGDIRGTVKDATGAIVTGAKVTVTNTDTNQVTRVETTNSSGQYTAPLLPVAHYSVTVEAQGFKTSVKSGIPLNVTDRLTIDAALQPGSASESVNVEADALQVDTQDATAQGLITGTQIRELSINNRNYEQLVALTPGVSSGVSDQIYIGVTNPSGFSNQINFSVNGSRPTQNNWTVDGADNVDRGANLTLLTYPSVDSISEFKILRGQYNAEYGRSSSGQVNVITRSGESKFHGSLYEFFRNDIFNANSYLNKHNADPINNSKVPKLRYHDFGGTFGGPVFIPGVYNSNRNKTFFFFSEEARRVITYSPFLSGEVPTAAELAGNFGAYGPQCLNAACTATGTQVTAINPVAQAYIKDIYSRLPAPTFGDPLHPQYQFTGRNIFNSRQEIYKVDHVFSQALSVNVKYENDSIPTVEQGGLFTGSSLPGVATTNTNSPGHTLVARGTIAFSPTLLNDIGYAYSSGAVVSDATGLASKKQSPDVNPTLPFANLLDHVPSLAFNDGEQLLGAGPYRDYNKNHNIFDNLTKVLGRHSIKLGATYNFYQKNENDAGLNGGANNGRYTFSDADPSGNGTFQQEFANFLSGNVSNFFQTNQDFHARIRQQQFEVYGQDEFRWKPNFTLNYGVRYSYFHAPRDAANQLISFDPSRYQQPATNPIDPTTGQFITPSNPYLNGVVIAGKGSPYGNSVQRTPKLDFAPRVGFAWDPANLGKTSIRGGYGIFFDSPAVDNVEQFQFSNPPFVQPISITTTVLDNPSAGSIDPSLASTPNFLGGPETRWKQPYTEQWSLDIQQDLGHSFIADIGYYGSAGKHLIGVVDINQPLPGAYATAGLVTTPYITDATTPLLNFVRPYKGFDAINLFEPIFKSNYNSLQAQIQKRLTGNSLVVVNYTWSHALTNGQNDFRTPQNTYDLRSEYGGAQFDRRHILTADFVYTLPFLRDEKGFLGHALGGWEFSGIVTGNSGLPLTVTGGKRRDPAGLGLLDANSFSGRRPDQIGDPNSGAPRTFTQWFNTAAFANVPTGSIRAGNAPRGSVRGPGLIRWDQSLFKNFRITEGSSLQFRAEAFNVLNHTNFDGVRTTLNSSTFGQVISTRDPRILQLALKLLF